MQANLSFIFNIVFLAIILSMIVWKMRPKFNKKIKEDVSQNVQEPIDDMDNDIITIRKVEINEYQEEAKPSIGTIEHAATNTIMIFLAAKGQSTFAGYDLLQTLLSSGLRYGDAGLFHRHQHASGQGPVLFSLAAATATGKFELQNMGATSVKGLCMFMELSGNITIDSERFAIFMQTAKQLADDLQANLLDERKQPLVAATIKSYEHLIAKTTELV